MRTVLVDDNLSVGSHENALVILWRDVPDARALDGVGRAAEALLRDFPGGIGILGVSGPLPLASADDRRRLAPLLGALGNRLLGMASIIEGSERVRDVMTSLNLVMRHPCPLKVFATVDEGVAWLAPLLRLRRTGFPGPRAAALRHTVEGLRRESVTVLYS
jgi:hypothetical protein